MKKHRSLIGFICSFSFHAVLVAAFLFAVTSSADESANGQISEEVSTNISIEMMMAMVEAEPEPEAIQEIIPEPKEEIPDPTVKPEPEKVKELEKPKEPEKPKPKPKEKPKPKPKKEARPKDAVQGNRTVDSPHKVDSKSSGPQATSSNPNQVGGSGKEIDTYRSRLRREVEKNKDYPQRDRMMRKQGVVTVLFTIADDGSIQNPRLAKSSGHSNLDRAALRAVQNTRSVGPRPAGMKPEVTLPIRFTIE